MAPATYLISSLARSRVQGVAMRQIGAGRNYASAAGRRTASSPTWDTPLQRVTGTMMMFIPVTALVMFWPVVVGPTMDWIAERS